MNSIKTKIKQYMMRSLDKDEETFDKAIEITKREMKIIFLIVLLLTWFIICQATETN